MSRATRSFLPTFTVPVIFGFTLVRVPAATLPVATDVDTVAYPDFVPVTVTVIFLPLSAAFNVYTASVAPTIAVPDRSH